MAWILAAVAVVTAAVLGVAVVLVVLTLADSGETESEVAPDVGAPAPDGGVKCGVERWGVKTLSDSGAAKVDFAPIATTVSALRSEKLPVVGRDTARLPGIETRTVTVEAQLISAKGQDDHDIHLVIADLSDRAKTLIVELPDVGCSGPNQSAKRPEMEQARRDFVAACGEPPKSKFVTYRAGATATITGVVFVDEVHGQRGVAPNGVEIHPVLKIEVKGCR